MMTKKAIAVLSGGLDSCVATCVYAKDYEIHGITFNYGQKSFKQELKASKEICEKMGFTHEVQKEEDKKAQEFAEKMQLKVNPESLVEFGLIPEFIGRLPVVCTLEELNKEALMKILKEPKNSLVKQFVKIFAIEKVELQITDNAIEQIAHLALLQKTGARGLKSIMEEVFAETMFVLPELTGKTVVLNDIYKGVEVS